MWQCANCGEQVEDDFEVCWNCQSQRAQKQVVGQKVNTPSTVSRTQESGVAGTAEAQALVKRYWDAYFVARVTVGFGKFIKIVGIVLAIVIILGTLLISNEATSRPTRDDSGFAFGFGVMGFVSACITGLLFYLLGVLISAIGEILKAVLDSAVNTSPLLTNEHRVKIMSLR